MSNEKKSIGQTKSTNCRAAMQNYISELEKVEFQIERLKKLGEYTNPNDGQTLLMALASYFTFDSVVISDETKINIQKKIIEILADELTRREQKLDELTETNVMLNSLLNGIQEWNMTK